MIHSGASNYGHYYAYIKSFENNRWYCFNDYNVKQLNVNEIQKAVYGGNGTSNAYVLYYKVVDN